jgi:hypothetical protein
MLINLYIFLHMQNGYISLAAAEAAGVRGEPGNRIPPLNEPTDSHAQWGHVCEH